MRWCLYSKELGGYYWSWRYDTAVSLGGAVLFSSERAARQSANKSRLAWEPIPVRLTVLHDG